MIWHPARLALCIAFALFCIVLPIRIFFGSTAALLALMLCLLPPAVVHVRGLLRLIAWLRAPLDAPVPEGGGIWDFIFAALHRRVRQRNSLKDALARALNSFRTAAEAMPDGIIRCDRDGRIEWMNRRAATPLALDQERDCGQFLIHLVRHPGFVCYLQAGEFDEPFIHYCQRGSGLTLMLHLVPFGENESLLVSRDISRFERLETMRRDFVANVSHELKTPLTVIHGFAETLIDDFADQHESAAARYLSLIHEQSSRMHCIIRDLLTLSALENAGSADAGEAVAMAPLLAVLLHDAEALSAGRHQIESSIDPSAPFLFGCPTELQSAFANLVSNAIRYSPDGGRIRIIWQRFDTTVEFAVEDSGIGIDSEHIPRLTERFYRVDRGRSAKIGGTGLGLAIVKHILGRHGAELRISSEPGKGSRFAAVFPAMRLPSEVPSEAATLTNAGA